jgi:hypothetical protein
LVLRREDLQTKTDRSGAGRMYTYTEYLQRGVPRTVPLTQAGVLRWGGCCGRGAVGLGGGTPGGGGDTNAGGERREPGALGVREGGQAIVEGASAAARAQGGRRIPRALLGKVRWAAGRVLRGLGEGTALVCAPGGC